MKTRTNIESRNCCHTQQITNTFLNLCNTLKHLMSKNVAYITNTLRHNTYYYYGDYYFMKKKNNKHIY